MIFKCNIWTCRADENQAEENVNTITTCREHVPTPGSINLQTLCVFCRTTINGCK